LERELGVEPLPSTRALIDNTLGDQPPNIDSADNTDLDGPLLPLVGREQAFTDLQATWNQVLAGDVRLTIVRGRAGIGKTRLVKTFLNLVGGRKNAAVLAGRCYPLTPVAYQPFPRLLHHLVIDDSRRIEAALAAMRPTTLGHLARLVPDVRTVRRDVPKVEPDPERLRGAVIDLIGRVCETTDDGANMPESAPPVVLFVDDLHHAHRDTLLLLSDLVERLRGLRL
ncbi:MAG: ATP-binding protein, partial [Acidobacteriota bacterium]